jgi:hypothetical protein
VGFRGRSKEWREEGGGGGGRPPPPAPPPPRPPPPPPPPPRVPTLESELTPSGGAVASIEESRTSSSDNPSSLLGNRMCSGTLLCGCRCATVAGTLWLVFCVWLTFGTCHLFVKAAFNPQRIFLRKHTCSAGTSSLPGPALNSAAGFNATSGRYTGCSCRLQVAVAGCCRLHVVVARRKRFRLRV